MRIFSLAIISLSLLLSCQAQNSGAGAKEDGNRPAEVQNMQTGDRVPSVENLSIEQLDASYPEAQKAYFAGGCFWCTEAAFQRIEGVIDVYSGYSGGPEENPGYRQVASGMTGHAEAVVVYYDPEVVTYETLLDVFFVSHDPTQLNRQGPDVGTQYRSAVFFMGAEQEAAVTAKIEELGASGKFSRPIVTQVEEASNFYLAEDYHQNYYEQERPPNYGYVLNVTKPKVEKVLATFPELIKAEYQ
ncbi:MAG: peptide-methionine (S)-S-oxide reductase MsrA [Bacteroidota bacterium]